jgi:DNA-directed RNA polymerase subunit omega
MNSENCKKALEKVGNPNVLVNLISRRVRQLTSAGGTGSRPLIAEWAGLGWGDIALIEIIEGKMDFELLEQIGNDGDKPSAKKRGKKSSS